MANCKVGRTYPKNKNTKNCKGDLILGTACGKCEKCKKQINNIEVEYETVIGEDGAKQNVPLKLVQKAN